MYESLAVPNLWTAKRTTRIAIDMDEISSDRLGTVRAIPATAEVTETAGVNMPSARVRAVPNRV